MSRGTRTWLFTINNPTSNEIPKTWSQVKYCIWQLEKGDEGTPHLQGYVSFTVALRLNALKKIDSKAHWEARKGTVQQAIAYCSKEETRVAGPWEIGKIEQGKRNDLAPLQDDLDGNRSMKFISKEHFHPYLKYHRGIQNYRRLHQPVRTEKTFVGVIVGETGVGKSRLMAQRFPDAFWKSCGDKWWDDYDFQDTVIIDEFYGWLPYAYLLRLLDRYPINVESKGGMLNFNPKNVWICSNNEPFEWYKWSEKMKFEPLLRRIDFLAIMKSDGSFEVRKGVNPFDKFPDTNDIDDDSVCNIPIPNDYEYSFPDVNTSDIPISLLCEETLTRLPKPIPLRETTIIPDIGDSEGENNLSPMVDSGSDTDDNSGAAATPVLTRKNAGYYFEFSSDDELSE